MKNNTRSVIVGVTVVNWGPRTRK